MLRVVLLARQIREASARSSRGQGCAWPGGLGCILGVSVTIEEHPVARGVESALSPAPVDLVMERELWVCPS